MYEYLPILIVGSIIGAFAIVFIIAYAAVKNKKEEYERETDIENLAVFVRSLIGLSQEAVNEKFGEYLNGNTFNSTQQEFVRAIINYVRENGDISREDLVEKSPFDNYDILTLFGENISSIIDIVGILHNSVNVVA